LIKGIEFPHQYALTLLLVSSKQYAQLDIALALPNDFPSQMIIFESSPAEAKYLLSGDQETSVTSSFRKEDG
jgi:hypothetical protein